MSMQVAPGGRFVASTWVAGSFTRQRILFLHLNGGECPALRRGRANAQTASVLDTLRTSSTSCIHASLEVHTPEEATADVILSRVRHVFVADDLRSRSVDRLLREFEHNPQELPVQSADPLSHLEDDCSKVPSELSILPCIGTSYVAGAGCFETRHAALREVVKPSGSWNWVLLDPDRFEFPPIAGGAGSVDEMRSFINSHPSSVLFGLLRLSFGTSILQRPKYVFVHYIGESVPAVRRGVLGAKRLHVRQEVAEYVECSIALEITRSTDLRLETVAEKVRGATAVEGSVLEQTQHCRHRLSVEDAISMVSAPSGALNWALFGPAGELPQPNLNQGLCSEGSAKVMANRTRASVDASAASRAKSGGA